MPQQNRTGRSLGSGSTGSSRRAELLAIAADLFATNGVRATTVRDIADTAGILSGSLYHHFDSKESVVDEILRDFLDEQQRSYRDVLEEVGDPRERISELIRRTFHALEHRRQAIAIFQNDANYLMRFDRFEYLREASAEFERIWMRVLRDGQRADVFRPELDVRLVYRFVRDAVWTTVRWYEPRGELGAREIGEQYITMLCTGLLTPGVDPGATDSRA